MNSEEIWKDIPGYGGHYQASSLGRIRSKDRIVRKYSAVAGKVVDQLYRGRIIGTKTPNDEGYMTVHLGIDGRKHCVQVGRLVLLAFVGEPGAGEECCHGPGGPADNSVGNLRWDIHLENNRDRVRAGTYKVGAEHHATVATEDVILRVKRGELTPKQAASLTGLDYKIFWRAKRGETWRHLGTEAKLLEQTRREIGIKEAA